MLLSIKTAHFNFTLIYKSSPQFIRLNGAKCRLSKVIVHLWILAGQGKPFFCRSATRTFLRICRLIIYRNVAMLLKPSLSCLASAGTSGLSVTKLTRITICPRHRPLLGHQSHARFGGKTRHKLPNAKRPSKYDIKWEVWCGKANKGFVLFFEVALLRFLRDIGRIIKAKHQKNILTKCQLSSWAATCSCLISAFFVNRPPVDKKEQATNDRDL